MTTKYIDFKSQHKSSQVFCLHSNCFCVVYCSVFSSVNLNWIIRRKKDIEVFHETFANSSCIYCHNGWLLLIISNEYYIMQ